MSRIIGHFDIITDDAVVGWAADLDRPAGMEEVICRGANGDTRRFRTFCHRQDVCEALGLAGKFGFAIPLSAVRHLGPVISLAGCDGTVLQHGETVRLPGPPNLATDTVRDDDERPVHVLLHIPKTAGTSIRSALIAGIPQAETVLLYPGDVLGLTLDELNLLPFHQRRAFRVAMGHTYFGIAKYLPRRAEYITVLREPLARLRSNFHHHVASGTRFEVRGVALETAEVTSRSLTEEFDNLMTRTIAGIASDVVPIGMVGEKDVELALHNIRTVFRFVGLTGQLNEMFPTLCAILGIRSGPLEILNIRHTADPGSLEDDVDWEAAMHRNRFDQMLYDRVRDEGLSGKDLRA